MALQSIMRCIWFRLNRLYSLWKYLSRMLPIYEVFLITALPCKCDSLGQKALITPNTVGSRQYSNLSLFQLRSFSKQSRIRWFSLTSLSITLCTLRKSAKRESASPSLSLFLPRLYLRSQMNCKNLYLIFLNSSQLKYLINVLLSFFISSVLNLSFS